METLIEIEIQKIRLEHYQNVNVLTQLEIEKCKKKIEYLKGIKLANDLEEEMQLAIERRDLTHLFTSEKFKKG